MARATRRKLVGLAIGLAILAAIYWQIDPQRLGSAILATDLGWLLLGISIFLSIVALTALRLVGLAPRAAGIGFGRALRLVLMAGTLNMLLPSKLGDIAKAHAMTGRRDSDGLSGTDALALVVLEKAWDLLSLMAFCALGLLLLAMQGWSESWAAGWLVWALALGVLAATLAGLLLVSSSAVLRFALGLLGAWLPVTWRARVDGFAESWTATLTLFWADRMRVLSLIFLSLLIWLLHLLQIWLFILALGGGVPFLAHLGLTPLAIFVGLLPVTFAGVGTRDAALILFFAPWLDAPRAAVLGLLCILRYLLPALAGLPFLGGYLAALPDRKTASPGP